MRILYVANKYDYGLPERGYDFLHYNFYDTLIHMGHDIIYFDFMSLMREHGRKWMNNRLMDVVKKEKPDLMFTVLFRDELDRKIVSKISEKTDTVTLNWFCDDHWRFDNFSRHWAPCFNWVVTTAESALPKYAKIGYRNVIKSQWACNHFLYKKLNLPLKYDVTFVGQNYGNRRETIEALRRAGINVHVWGHGWESGRISQEELIRVFNQSKINLNFSRASTKPYSCFSLTNFYRKGSSIMSKALDIVPFGNRVRSFLNSWQQSRREHDSKTTTVLRDQKQEYPDQIKGRNFEIPGCGGFLLTEPAENLEDYYEIGKEVVCFDGVDDLIDKIKYYLAHEDERIAIARAGYERTLREHTYERRFNEIFKKIGVG